ncbi:MAG: hypothetical protein J6X34_09375 [Clostridia bacterium]|nr:hypothetical protein [Clostridia bacterium]
MNKIVSGIITKQASRAAENVVGNAKEIAENIKKLGDENIIISRRVFSLQIAVAVLGGIVFGMLISPRKKVSYKIASENRDIGTCDCCPCKSREEDYDGDDDDDDDNGEDEENSGSFSGDDLPDDGGSDDGNGKSKFIRL